METEARVNMALDDVVKSSRAEAAKAKKLAAAQKAAAKVPAKKGKGKDASDAKGAKKPGSAASKTKLGKKVKAEAVPSKMEVDHQKKVAGAVATARKKRGAKIDERRGLNTTGKASTQDIKAAVKKAQAKVINRAVSIITQKGKGKNKGKGKVAPSTFKISFNPKQLAKSIPVPMMKQIQGVLSKQPKGK